MKNRRIVITGVGRGLGRAMTLEFAAAGHTVLGCARSRDSLDSLARQLPAPHCFDVVDVADDRAVQRWAESALAGGPPELLINNAALINRNAPLWQVPAEEFSDVIDVNIKGVANVLRHFLPAMIRAKRGVVVNFSSGWGRSTAPDVAPYCATKWAVEGLTQALAQELPPGMAAVALNPGIINTDMLRSCFAEHAAEYPSPERWGKRAAAFLLGLDASDNGQSLTAPN
jgi:NAD(P)-dependent dehydrogenase (short-subunit alcohol dehydrogenase family)